MRTKWLVVITLLLVLALALAACGGDDDDTGNNASDNAETASEEPTAETDGSGSAVGFSPSGPSISLGADLSGGSDLPGCSDPDDEECPAALVMDLDGEASAGGVTINFPARYFDALTGADASDGALIQIVPSENNKYAESANFAVLLVDSLEGTFDGLVEPESAEWTTDTLTGTIMVSKDAEQDPPANRTVGAFETADGRAVLLTLDTTGKYGWDLWAQVYVTMLDTLVVDTAG